MENQTIFLPVVFQILLTLWLYIYLSIAKSRAAKLGQVDETRRALHDDAWPDNVLQINNCIRNQFEVPVLFYVLILTLWSLNAINIAIHILAWVFVLSRAIHAFIHTGSNQVPQRRKVFSFGCLILIVIALFSLVTILF
jgi:hypothetical protein